MSTRVRSISPKRLHALHDAGEPVELIDVRTPAEYRAEHASEAKLLPLDELSSDTLVERTRQPGLGRDKPLYLICQSGSRAQEAAMRLIETGFPNVALVDGGTEAWSRAGLPTQGCGSAMSLERQVQIAIGLLLVLKVFLGFTLNELFFAAIPLIGAGLIVAGITRWCGMAKLIAVMPWNRNGECKEPATA